MKSGEHQLENLRQEEQRYNFKERRGGYNPYGDEFYAFVLTNLSISKSIEEHGVEVVESILKEMSQMHEKGVWSPLI